MTDTDMMLGERLEASGTITAGQHAAAKELAVQKGTGLSEALVALSVVAYVGLGRCLCELHRLPYRPLMLQKPFSDQARSIFSPRAAAAWGVFPLAHDARQNLLTLAVHDPAQMLKVDRMRRLLMQPYDLAFTIASKPEIETAFQVHFGILVSAAGMEKLKLTGIEKAMLKPKAFHLSRRNVSGPGTDVPYADMSKALLSTVAWLATDYCKASPPLLRKLQRRVRYCTLLSSRLSLPPIQTDALILAAWLSPLEQRREVARQLPARYSLTEILFPEDILAGDPKVESKILSLVEAHGDFEDREPSSARDVTQVRRHLRTTWALSREQQEMLETFLQVLVDEEFVEELQRHAASILVVDSSGGARADIMPSLVAEGYNVSVVRGEAAAWDVISTSHPSLIVSELDLLRENGLDFCTRVKRASQTPRVGFFVVAKPDEQDRALECLRAGADEFLTRPVAPEVLVFKIQKFLSSPDRKDQQAGLSGSLGDMSLVDMIQILSAGSRSVEIAVTHGNQQGAIVMESGDIVHARCGELAGEAALYAILRWEKGEFTTRPSSAPPERTIHGSVMSLLMEGARVADESQEAAAETDGSG